MAGTQPRDGDGCLAGAFSAVDRPSRSRLQRGGRGSALLRLDRRPGGRCRRAALEAVLRAAPASEPLVEVEPGPIPTDACDRTRGPRRPRRVLATQPPLHAT